MLTIVIFNTILITLGLSLLYLVIRKEIQNLNSSKNDDYSKFADLQKILVESFSLLKQEVSDNLKSSIEKQLQIIQSSSKLEELARNLETSVSEIGSFKEILLGPKNRGYLGEIMLEEILKNLPSDYYEKQYLLGNDRVDYILKINDHIIPIDSKFPVHNFSSQDENSEKTNKEKLKKELIRNIKSKIEEISKKYILPSRGTVEFAIMYLANEGIYYELLSDKFYDDVWDLAREKSVFITSPKTFELICSSLLLIIRRQELSNNVKEILDSLNQLEKDLIELHGKFNTSYNQLINSFRNFQEISRILTRFITNFKTLIKKEEKLESSIKEKTLV